MNLSTQCQKQMNGCFCSSVYVKNAVHTDVVVPRTIGGHVSIPSLIIPPPDCLTLTADHTVVGCGAGGNLGNSNTSVGQNALAVAVSTNNVAVGRNAGESITTGGFNVLVGRKAGDSLINGSTNIFIGTNSGSPIVDGSDNTFIGHNVGSGFTSSNLSGCVLIGQKVGFSNTTDNRLMIDNSSTDDPLTDGDFAGDTVKFNGTVIVSSPHLDQMQFDSSLITITPKTASNVYVRVHANGGTYYLRLWED